MKGIRDTCTLLRGSNDEVDNAELERGAEELMFSYVYITIS